MQSNTKPSTVQEYIQTSPPDVQPVLYKIQALIQAAAPDAAERIAWSMPTYTGKHNLVHFAAHKAHLGFYPGAEAIVHFQKQLAEYKTSKGAIQFSYGKQLPAALITDMVRYCVQQDAKK